MKQTIDDTDRRILSILLENGGVPKAEIARRLSLAASVISERIRRLESDGVIQGYEIRLNARRLGKPLLAFIFVTDAKPTRGFDTADALLSVKGLEELHKIAGEDCYLLKVRAENTDELNAIIEEQINPVQSVNRVRTTIVLKPVMERPPLAGFDLVDRGEGDR